MAGEDLVITIAVDVRDPERVAIRQCGVEDVTGFKFPGSLSFFQTDGDLRAMPGLDRGEKASAIRERAEVDLTATTPRGLADLARCQTAGDDRLPGGLELEQTHAEIVSRQDFGPAVAVKILDLDRMK